MRMYEYSRILKTCKVENKMILPPLDGSDGYVCLYICTYYCTVCSVHNPIHYIRINCMYIHTVCSRRFMHAYSGNITLDHSEYLCTGARDTTVKLWDTSTQTCVREKSISRNIVRPYIVNPWLCRMYSTYIHI